MQGRSHSVYSSVEESESDSQQEWMRKYYSLLTATEFKEKLVAETLHSVETEVQGLNGRVLELQSEKKRLEREVERLREVCADKETRLQGLEAGWAQEKGAWERAAERERKECTQELEQLNRQLQQLKRQFHTYRERYTPEHSALLKKLHQLETLNQRFRKENVDMKRGLGSLRRELRLLHKPQRTSSLCRSLPPSKRSASRGRLSPSDRGQSLEAMLASVEARLQQAKELVLEDQ